MSYTEFLEKYNDVSKKNQIARSELKSLGMDLDSIIRNGASGNEIAETYLETMELKNEMYRNGYIQAKAWETLSLCPTQIAKFPGECILSGTAIKPGDAVRMKNTSLTVLTRDQVGGQYVIALDSEF